LRLHFANMLANVVIGVGQQTWSAALGIIVGNLFGAIFRNRGNGSAQASC
jgi:hypothetical protein